MVFDGAGCVRQVLPLLRTVVMLACTRYCGFVSCASLTVLGILL